MENFERLRERPSELQAEVALAPGPVGDETDGIVDPTGSLLPVVGLGGSQGALASLQTFFNSLPPDTGMAYVVVVHLSPEHESIMSTILQRHTTMPVTQVRHPEKLVANRVYVIPPGKHLLMREGVLQPVDFDRPRGSRVAVDLFFRALAETHGTSATAIVLSGGDGDGASGLKRVKERGGLTIAQDPTEAEAEGMPRSAIATGMVDWVLPVAEIPQRLISYRDNRRKIQLPPVDTSGISDSKLLQQDKDEACLRDILSFLRTRSGHDFSYYKRATILRRIGRRMQVSGTETLEEYLAYLRTHPGESGALLQDLLISVTNFFRDRESFVALESEIPRLFADKTEADQVRVWVPACASGEEAYSIAILLCEQAAKMESPPQIQVFATDLDNSAIEFAREGRFPHNISADVSEDRLRMYFSKEPGGYRVRRNVREIVLFAMHDLLKDSPFSRLDLISCRNLLIYLRREAQTRVFDIFHFALIGNGRLFLGSSESGEEVSAMFRQDDKKHRIYTRRTVPRVGLTVPSGAATLNFAYKSGLGIPGIVRVPEPRIDPSPLINPARPEGSGRHSWGETHFQLLERLAPPSILVSRGHDVLHISESAGKYLRITGGEPAMNLLRVIRPELRTELRAALFLAVKSQQAVRIANAPLTIDGTPVSVEITVEYLADVGPEFLLVLFRERAESSPALRIAPGVADPEEAEIVHHLEEELDLMRANWRDTVEQYEASTEELKASNEELQAMNEELRSATEELETGREELQSINEEIITINQELKSKVEELSRANSDLQNLMASTKIATIFLDRKLRIARFTPSTSGLFNFISTDIGRPLSDLTHRLDYTQITADADRVLESLAPVEREVRNTEGRWFLARMFPYRTTEDVIAGVVITLVDITERKQVEDSRKWLSAIVESANDAIVSFDMDGRVISWNRGAERVFGFTAAEMVGESMDALVPADHRQEKLQTLEKLRQGEEIPQYDTIRRTKAGTLIDVTVSASVMKNEAGEIVGATAIVLDISDRKRAVEELRQARDELEQRVQERTAELSRRVAQLSQLGSDLTLIEQRERDRMARVLHDELQQLLVAAKMKLEAYEDDGNQEVEGRRAATARAVSLIDEALVNSRSLAVELSPPILADGLGKALEWLCHTWIRDNYDLEVHSEIDTDADASGEDTKLLGFLAVRELLFNVVKHGKVSEAWVTMRAVGESLEIVIRDHGLGFDSTQLHRGSGSGFGLVGLRERLELLGGSLELDSVPNGGVTATVRVPRMLSEETATTEKS